MICNHLQSLNTSCQAFFCRWHHRGLERKYNADATHMIVVMYKIAVVVALVVVDREFLDYMTVVDRHPMKMDSNSSWFPLNFCPPST